MKREAVVWRKAVFWALLMVATLLRPGVADERFAHSERHKLGAKAVGDVCQETVNPPGEVVNGHQVNPGNWLWGGSNNGATWTASFPAAPAAQHDVRFEGKYRPRGGIGGNGGSGGPELLDWEMDVLVDGGIDVHITDGNTMIPIGFTEDYNEYHNPGDATITWSVKNGTGAATIDAAGKLIGTKAGTVTIKVKAEKGGKTGEDEREVTIIRVDLMLKNTGTIVPSPENEKYEHEKRASGTDKLGELPIGEGRMNDQYQDKSYIAPIMVIGTVIPESAATLVFRWKRFHARQTWDIMKNANGNMWKVISSQKIGIPIYKDDTGADVFNDPTPSIEKRRIYMYDCAGVCLAHFPRPTIGDYVYSKIDFIYQVDVKINDSWYEGCAKIHVGQKVIAQKIATTGVIKNDWKGIENSNAIRTLDCYTITNTEIRNIVGGTLPIEISSRQLN